MTAAAYQRAVSDGADGLECDVRLSRDGVLVLIHDATVNRTTAGRGSVRSMTYAELAPLGIITLERAHRFGRIGEPRFIAVH